MKETTKQAIYDTTFAVSQTLGALLVSTRFAYKSRGMDGPEYSDDALGDMVYGALLLSVYGSREGAIQLSVSTPGMLRALRYCCDTVGVAYLRAACRTNSSPSDCRRAADSQYAAFMAPSYE